MTWQSNADFVAMSFVVEVGVKQLFSLKKLDHTARLTVFWCATKSTLFERFALKMLQ